MNKVFKVIWNQATQSFVVVSELTKAKGKTASNTDKRMGATLATTLGSALLALSVAPVASGASITLSGTVKSGDEVTIDASTADAADQGIAIGNNAAAYASGGLKNTYTNSIAIGNNVTAASGNADTAGNLVGTIAIGTGINASSSSTTGVVAIGSCVTVNAAWSIAMGTLVGVNAGASESVAIGPFAKVYGVNDGAEENGVGAIAIGSKAAAKGASSIALGRSSVTNGTGTTAVGYLAKAQARLATAVGVAANASANQSSAFGRRANSTGIGSVALGNEANAMDNSAVALGNQSRAIKTSAIAVGYNANATENRSIAIGQNATAFAQDSVVLGSFSSDEGLTATNQTTATINGYTYSGFKGNVSSTGQYVSVGSGENASRQIKYVAAGTVSNTSTDAINGSQLYMVADRLEKGWNIQGATNGGTTENATNLTTVAVKPTETVKLQSGKNIQIDQRGKEFTFATADNVTFNQVNTTTLVVGNVSDPNNSTTITSGTNGLDVGGDKITNVTNGTLSDNSKDAVNGSQLYETNQNVTNVSNNLTNLTTLVDGGLTFAGDTGTASNRKLNTTLNIVGGVKDNTTLTANNIGVDSDGKGTLTVKLNKDLNLTSNGSIVIGGTNITNGNVSVGNISITNNGIDAGDHKITNVTNGTVAPDSKDAVNGGQLYNASSSITNIFGGNTTYNNTTGKVEGFSRELNTTGLAKDATYTKPAAATNITEAFNQLNNYVNAGWKVGNATAVVVERIAPDEQVNFINSNTTNATVVANSQGGANISFDVNVTAVRDALTNATTNVTSDGKGNVVNNGDQLLNASAIVNLLNSAFWTANASATGTGENKSEKDEKLSNVTAGTAVNFIAGDNLEITKSGTNFTYATKQNVAFNQVNTTTLVVGNASDPTNSTTITSGTNGLDVGGDKITNVTNGTLSDNSKDAVNGSQLYETNQNVTNVSNNLTNLTTLVDGGLTFAGDTGTASNRKLNTTLNIVGGVKDNTTLTANNIGVDSDGKGTLTVKLNKDLNLTSNGSIVIGGTNITNGNVSVGNISITNNGIDAGDHKITNVTNGTLSDNSKDAVNGSQLYATNQNITNITNAIGGGLNFGGDDRAEEGHIANRKLGTLLNITGGADKTKLSDNNIGVNYNTTSGNLEVKLSQTLNLTKDGSIVIGGTNITNGNVSVGNISITNNGIDAGDHKITNVTNGTLSDNSKDAVNGSQLYETNQNVTNVSNNLTNLTTLVDGGLTFAGDTGTASNRKLNTTLNIVGGVKDNSTLTANNIGVDSDGKGTLTVKLNKDLNLTSNGSIVIGGTNITNGNVSVGNISITNNGIDAGDHKITNVTNGTLSENSKDAVNGSQLYATNQNITNITNAIGGGLNFGGDDRAEEGHIANRKLGTLLNITGGADKTKLSDNNIGVNYNTTSGNLEVKLSKELDLTKDGKITIGNTTIADNKITMGNTTLTDSGLTIKGGPSITQNGIDAGNKKVTGVEEGDISATSKEAVNGSQLYQTNQNVSNISNNLSNLTNLVDGGLTFAGDTGTASKQKLNTTVNIVGGIKDNSTLTANNIGVDSDGKGTLTVKLNKDLNLTKDGSITIGNTSISNGNISLGNVSITTGGINAGNSTVTNVKDGANGTDAVNLNQLNNATANTTLAVENGKVATPTEGNKLVNATTVADTINNVSWGIGNASGAKVNDVKAGNQVNFVNGTNTIAKVEKGAEGITNVTFNVNTTKVGEELTTDAKTNANGTASVNGDGNKFLNATTVTNLINNSSFNATIGEDKSAFDDQAGKATQQIKAGETLTLQSGKNLKVKQQGKAITYALSDEIDLGKNGNITIGNTTISDGNVSIGNVTINNNGIDAGGNKITNVAPGVDGSDAVNRNQLNQVANQVNNNSNAINKLGNQVNKMNKDLRAGIAGATALSFIQRPHEAGKSMVSLGVGGYKGESAVAVGYGRNSDNNKISIKVGVGVNTRSDVNWGGSVGYQW